MKSSVRWDFATLNPGNGENTGGHDKRFRVSLGCWNIKHPIFEGGIKSDISIACVSTSTLTLCSKHKRTQKRHRC